MQVELICLTKKYPYEHTPVIDNLSITFPSGSLNTVLLETQSGKSTLCDILGGYTAPSGGKILFDGVEAQTIKGDKKVLLLKSKPLSFPQKSVEYNIAYPLKLRNIGKSEIARAVESICAQIGVSSKQKMQTLSDEQSFDLTLLRSGWRKVGLVICDDLTPEQLNKTCLTYNNGVATIVYCTSDLTNAVGRTVVVKDNSIVYDGDKKGSESVLNDIFWLNVTE